MLNIYSDTKIYVYCAADTVTGGAELMHQLVSHLRERHMQAYILYFNGPDHPVPDEYEKYNIAVTHEVEDNPHNIEVFYEGIFNLIDRTRRTQKFLWWISVDNFFNCSHTYIALHDLYGWNKKLFLTELWRRLKLLLKGINVWRHTISLMELTRVADMCGYQAEYIHSFLQKSGFRELAALKDYINPEHNRPFDTAHRENIVIYNPKKGIAFTRRIMNSAPDIKWQALEGMTRDELISTIRKAKLYIDFGNHPGKDRLPRECAANGCCIITGMKGSAAFREDVSIPGRYKFDEGKVRIKDIVDMIRIVLSDYNNLINDFAPYRTRIASEEAEFKQQIDQVFKINR